MFRLRLTNVSSLKQLHSSVRHVRTVAAIVVDESAPKNVGDLYSTVEVKAGYMRNFLFPRGYAVYATPVEEAKYRPLRAEREALLEQQRLNEEAKLAEENARRQAQEAERIKISKMANSSVTEAELLQVKAEEKKKERDAAQAEADKALRSALGILSSETSEGVVSKVQIEVAANESGKLYGGVESSVVAEALSMATGKEIKEEHIDVSGCDTTGINDVILRFASGGEMAVPIDIASSEKNEKDSSTNDEL
eukprot:g2437.t1